ncbi:BREX-1 system adenine-specific DNA-methyltransferase PglX [Hymenobacter sp. BT491]|uniref:BREX-1 system adenine-specific DNA-methyltransferase PglX n=1 Tax=Hymenobacter sp. BT491 TaxID=2766779 RepID=UPI001653E21C|nr:BREX-1 system adenine-specific DNA-methyltransferase PglX [Hymenobacter sp. BT491]MBC6992228.1 BREX-1 system adenine-specific DNA-methyltransferase PglX [Hymenobacter sp. BT491]
MNTNKLKKFAQDARKKLLAQVVAKLEYVLTTDTAELRERAAQVSALREELSRTGKLQLVEKVAYTWFNRLVALRFMDVNGYQPLGLRVLTPKEGHTLPELLDEAKTGHVAEELKVNNQLVFDLLDGRMPSANPQNEAYRVLLIGACNYLHTLLPFLFERINDYTELLLPDDLTSDFSVVHDVREGMAAEDCQQVEIIGWLYQFYISEKKDEVFASKAKVKKEDIPAATQLFTPRWIVEYMVQNTVGKLWLQNRPSSALREHMTYFIESASLQSEDYLKLSSPQELTLLDQACGSGHILVYGFELLYHIYEEEGFNPSEIPQLILEHNLYGFEIDERAAQLAAMALMMKARSYQRRFFKKGQVPQPHILCFQDLKLDENQVGATLASLDVKPSDALRHDLGHMRQATNLGSLIEPHASTSEIRALLNQIEVRKPSQADLFGQYERLQLQSALAQLQPLSKKYSCVVDNPPYMGGNMNVQLADFVKRKYPDSKADLMACFMERGLAMLDPKGFLGMINQQSWMFLSSYDNLRGKIINNYFIDTLLQIGYNSFPELNSKVVQAATFVIQNQETTKRLGTYYNLNDAAQSADKKSVFERKLNSKHHYLFNQNDFKKIPGSPIGYWLNNKFIEIFSKGVPIGDISSPRQGLASSDNNRFLKDWFEVAYYRISFASDSHKSAVESRAKWFPYNKGGAFRKWYGNNEYVINWENDGYELLNYAAKLYGSPTRTIKNIQHYFKKSITWSALSSGGISLRRNGIGFLFDTKGQCIFSESDIMLNQLMALLNSTVSSALMKVLAPTLDFNSGVIAKVPYIAANYNNDQIEQCVAISKAEWDSHETSWDFIQNELIRIKSLDLKEAFDLYQQYWKNKFFQLHKNEEDHNRQFIEVYGLQNELTPDVPLKNITILQEETSIENGKLVFHADEVMAQFVSYSVGCMFGRYSLDVPGLVLANQGETLQDYFQKLEKQEQGISFLPDADNIIPVLDDEWFEDDIVGRFCEFLKVTFSEANYAKNLAFVEECLGKDIRKYFVKDFYADHVQRYKKRPIYWMFSSPQGSFNVLIYMHRYTPDTVSHILNKYLREYQEKLRTRREHLVRVEVGGSASEKAKASKEKARLDSVLLELQEYERNILYPLATERIAIDLDNGVLVNYNKFGKAVKLVPGLNDAKAKKQVSEFDWVKEEETV